MDAQNKAALDLLDEPARSVVASMHEAKPQPGTGGVLHPLDGHTRIPLAEGALLYRMVTNLRPALTIEIGLAYGFSTAFILSGLRKNGHGRHIAIDPLQYTHWGGVGAELPSRIGCADLFTLILRMSFQALSEMVGARHRADFVFIDGDHLALLPEPRRKRASYRVGIRAQERLRGTLHSRAIRARVIQV